MYNKKKKKGLFQICIKKINENKFLKNLIHSKNPFLTKIYYLIYHMKNIPKDDTTF